ncbi:S8 family serine peptidase [Paenibacillus sp. GCM10012303]|uniref:S8 family serine peptidase n=1 Tax=Paenibacillus sp. GCM10012303 TaxID=3317340 RepID=UPI00361B3E15
MTWPSIRNFLQIPHHLTGKGVGIAVVDGRFPNHPDIAATSRRNTYLVKTSEPDPVPSLMTADDGPWTKGRHGLAAAAAAAGSGLISQGLYTGAAPDADLYLLETGRLETDQDVECKIAAALDWLYLNWRRYRIRGVVVTIAATRDTGLLPWQADPIRIGCEKLAADGLLVVAATGNTQELTSNGPASSPSVLSVGGVIVPEDADIRYAKPYYGCRGTTFEGKWVPEIVAPAKNIVLPAPFDSLEERQRHFTARFDNLPEGYARTEGTSFAAPIVLGCAACLWQAQPSWTAGQVKAAIVESSAVVGQCTELRAGLVDVKAAIHADTSVGENDPPYTLWCSWKQKDGFERLKAIKAQNEASIASAAVLSYCEAPISPETQEQVLFLIGSRSGRVRAAAVTALAFCQEALSIQDYCRVLHDDSRLVRMAALFALSRSPGLHHQLKDEVVGLFSDSDLDIRYCAIKLAGNIRDEAFVKPLLSGIEDDAIHERVSIFAARCSALEAITGMQFEPEPRWLEEQGIYSERSTQGRVHIARKWRQWASYLSP